MAAKTLTIRLPAAAYEQATVLAKKRNQSLNRLVQDGLNLLAQRERDRLLYEDFSRIAEAGADETDVEFKFKAQAQATAES